MGCQFWCTEWLKADPDIYVDQAPVGELMVGV